MFPDLLNHAIFVTKAIVRIQCTRPTDLNFESGIEMCNGMLLHLKPFPSISFLKLVLSVVQLKWIIISCVPLTAMGDCRDHSGKANQSDCFMNAFNVHHLPGAIKQRIEITRFILFVNNLEVCRALAFSNNVSVSEGFLNFRVLQKYTGSESHASGRRKSSHIKSGAALDATRSNFLVPARLILSPKQKDPRAIECILHAQYIELSSND